MNLSSKLSKNTIDIKSPLATSYFSNMFLSHLKDYYTDSHDEIIILCIGTDRSTGDSLGPLTGYKMKKVLNKFDKVHVYGTLDAPVHAKNLEEHIKTIYSSHKNPFIIAIDACLGKVDRVGYLTVSQGPLKPGAGVKKSLPSVGDIHITGIVNLGGFMEYIVLQNTRLSLVMSMAETISSAVYFGLLKFHNKNIKKKEQFNLS